MVLGLSWMEAPDRSRHIIILAMSRGPLVSCAEYALCKAERNENNAACHNHCSLSKFLLHCSSFSSRVNSWGSLISSISPRQSTSAEAYPILHRHHCVSLFHFHKPAPSPWPSSTANPPPNNSHKPTKPPQHPIPPSPRTQRPTPFPPSLPHPIFHFPSLTFPHSSSLPRQPSFPQD